MNETKKVLTRARDLIASGWTQHSYAKNSSGTPVAHRISEDASCFCISGAIDRAAWENRDFDDAYWSAERKVEGVVLDKYGVLSLIAWNDNEDRTQEEVLEVLDLAISYCGDGE